jgi:hypothetical protein
MNATLKHLRGIRQPRRADLSAQASQAASSVTLDRGHSAGSYGRGIYGRRATDAQDFSSQGSYGRGVYAGRSTADISFDLPGSYGRGVYAGRSTADLDFGAQASFASGR